MGYEHLEIERGNGVSARGDLYRVVREEIEGLLSVGPGALAATTKALLRGIGNAAPVEVTRITARRIPESRTGEECQEGLGAFLEKREPVWREKS
ncbi:MAG: hypothetical protein AVDCRST_MAG25-1005 [uncultured Rubrobacteraceae bacterium]|uniref:Enoyl-CoA hydratase n=1 Tax=uncultured Rubrobacteraceae bacterium TaxID=349277 RepID=A0A6J4RCN5_9ACTN|nr:MAG: hypothetical protein AVDCRST_MAG25-1005 [uncultured Rubrobacteraceae bacterium]